MQKVSYVANGETTTFYFNFPYFERDNIVVTVNNGPAPSYNLIGTRGGMDPDFPFTSGRIVFQKPPKHFDTVTIERHLPLVRPVDFQPLAQITSTMLNQDMNYTMELLKDMRDELDTLHQNYADISNKESTVLLLEKINLVNQNIADISEHWEVLDSIPGLQTAIESLQNTVETLAGDLSSCSNSIDVLNTRTAGILDFVIDSQEPSSQNNYRWFRKYKSGWVEQGGFGAKNEIITLAVTMKDTNYGALAGFCITGNNNISYSVNIDSKTTTSFKIRSESSVPTNEAYWHVYGFYQQI